MSIDVSESSGNIRNIQEWLTQQLIAATETEMYLGETPSYDELQGIFFDDYKRWCSGEHKFLREKNLAEFKIKFGEFMDSKRMSQPYEYLISILKRSVRQRNNVPCIIFDNADNFPPEFQDAVFQYAYALNKSVAHSIVIVPITDRTIWRLSRAGALQTYSAKVFYLPVPSTRDVLEKRVNFIRGKLESGKSDKSYFTSRGMQLQLKNLPAFAACLEATFLKTDFVARRVGGLANHHLRRSLELSQNIITAPIFKVDQLISAYFGNHLISISPADITKAMLCGEFNKFNQSAHQYILNLFLIEEGCLNSPLLRMRILRLLVDAANASVDNTGSYMAFEEIDRYFDAMGVATRAVFAATESLIRHRLIEPYDPISDELTHSARLAITYSGRMHMEMVQTESIYIEQMAQTTPIRSVKVVEEIKRITSEKMKWEDWAAVRREFVNYCLSEDAALVSLPSHQSYYSQALLRKELADKWCSEKGFRWG